MKKLIVSLFAAVLMMSGLATFTSGSADAASTACPYTGCIATRTKIAPLNNIKAGKKELVKFQILAAGKTAPKATVKIRVKKVGGGYYSQVTKASNAHTYTTPKLKKTGKYQVTVKYVPKAGSAYTSSSKTISFKVKKR